MNTNIKQVTELQVGDFTLELDEQKLIALCDVCESAGETIALLTEEMETLIRITDRFIGSETEAFPLLRTLCDVKEDYRQLMTLGIKRKEVQHG